MVYCSIVEKVLHLLIFIKLCSFNLDKDKILAWQDVENMELLAFAGPPKKVTSQQTFDFCGYSFFISRFEVSIFCSV